MFRSIINKKRLCCGLRTAPADISAAKLVFFYGPRFQDSVRYDCTNLSGLVSNRSYDRSKKTVVYVHGYIETMENESVNVVINAYLTRRDVNIIALDWGALAGGNYAFDAFVNARHVGRAVAKSFNELYQKGFDLSKLHIVGHSMGSHIAGQIGREIYKLNKKTKKVGRISGLDPAFPLYYMCGLVNHINKNDAEFVDIIHTDAWFYGTPFSTGRVDFWPNGGKTLQPGCPKRNYKMLTDIDLCGHWRSWWYWAESVENKYPEKFNALKFSSWRRFRRGPSEAICNNDQVVMGHCCPTNIKGKFYLQTNGKPPFARGPAGLIYVKRKELLGNTYEGPLES